MSIIKEKNERFNLADLQEETERLTNDINRIKNEINLKIEDFKNNFYLEIKKRLIENVLEGNFKIKDYGDEWILNYYDQIQFKGDYFYEKKVIEKLIGDNKITFSFNIDGTIEFPMGKITELGVTPDPIDDQLRFLKMYGNHGLILTNLLKDFPKERFLLKFTTQRNRDKAKELVISMADEQNALKKVINALLN